MARSVTLDIHNYEAKFQQAAAQVNASTISERNKTLILAYRDASLLQQTCGKVRLIRVMGALRLFARQLGKDFDAATREDVQRLVSGMLAQQPAYSPETIGTYKAILKRFYTWLTAPAEFSARAPAPPLVSWITTHVRTRDKKKLQRNQLLLPSDIEQVITVTQNTRDKALTAVLWETGGRIAEIGNLQLKHATKTDVGYILEVTGKTGTRSVLIVSSAPLLAQWLNVHPFHSDPEAPLWVHYQHRPQAEQMKYDTIRTLLRNQFRHANVNKRVYPHLFRHSRATYVLASGLMTEAQAKAYFGWTPNTDQLATYAHLLASDANTAILRENTSSQPARCMTNCRQASATDALSSTLRVPTTAPAATLSSTSPRRTNTSSSTMPRRACCAACSKCSSRKDSWMRPRAPSTTPVSVRRSSVSRYT